MLRVQLVFVGILLASAASAQAPHVIPLDTSWGSPLFLQVRVNGSEPLRFILDSASSWSMIRRAEAERFGLKASRSESASAAGGEYRMDFSRADLELGHLKLESIELGLTNLPKHYAGILGADLFERYVVVIDYTAGSVTVYEPKNFRPKPEDQRLNVEIRGRIPCIPASIGIGKETAKGEFHVDTASWAAIMTTAAFAANHLFPPKGSPVERIRAGSISGSAQFLMARADWLQLGDWRFYRPLVTAYTTNSGREEQTVGHIGNNILRRFRVTFDCPHGQIFFSPNASLDQPFEWDMSGLVFGPDFRITTVIGGSPADSAGLQPGDQVVSINGIEVEKLGYATARGMLIGDGAKCEIQVNRNNQRLRTMLTLKRRI